jgi:hypothetical protein
MPLLKVAPSSGENHLYAAYQDDSGSCFIYRAHTGAYFVLKIAKNDPFDDHPE